MKLAELLPVICDRDNIYVRGAQKGDEYVLLSKCTRDFIDWMCVKVNVVCIDVMNNNMYITVEVR